MREELPEQSRLPLAAEALVHARGQREIVVVEPVNELHGRGLREKRRAGADGNAGGGGVLGHANLRLQHHDLSWDNIT